MPQRISRATGAAGRDGPDGHGGRSGPKRDSADAIDQWLAGLGLQVSVSGADRLLTGDWEVTAPATCGFFRLAQGSALCRLAGQADTILPVGTLIVWSDAPAPVLKSVPVDWPGAIPISPGLWSPEESFAETRIWTAAVVSRSGARNPLARMLSPRIFRPEDAASGPTLFRLAALLDAECRDPASPSATRDQLAGVVLFEALRRCLTESPPATGWLRGQDDPDIGPILQQMADHPEKNWSLIALAELGGMSRATFARRFREVVGCAPMDWLLNLRMERASDQLSREAVDLKTVAREAGYSSASAFCAAFKRWAGHPPGELRRPSTGNSLRT